MRQRAPIIILDSDTEQLRKWRARIAKINGLKLKVRNENDEQYNEL